MGFGCFMIPFLAVWVVMMGGYVYNLWVGVPSGLERWAKERGYDFVSMERRSFRRGPFFWNTSNTQLVYRIEVIDREGLTRRGWLRIGGYFWPSASPIVERWDAEQPPPPRVDLPMWDRQLDS